MFAPVYDHQSYDIVPAGVQEVDRPDILVVEGLNVLQAGRRTDGTAPEVFLSDFFDFSVYVDAAEADIQHWYVERFLALRRTAFQDTTAYFHRFAALTDEQARETAQGIWAAMNGPNLRDNIAPDPVEGPARAAKGERPHRPPGPAPQALICPLRAVH